MINLIDKFIIRSNNLDYVAKAVKNLSKDTPVKKIFEAINKFSPKSEIRYVGGCIRKIIRKETVSDIDLATNLDPQEVCRALKDNKINYHETGLAYGTVTAIIDDYTFEITTLREDYDTDGRHAKVKFSNDWKKDASRRDFTINSIYSDIEGNLFDPFNGRYDLEKGFIKFIGDPELRIKEDYLRILRYLRFFLAYSKDKHNLRLSKLIKKNITGVSNLSKERLLDELKKFFSSNIMTELSNDKFSVELFEYIFPQIKKIKYFSKPNSFAKIKLKEADFIFLLSILIIDGSDNVDYFIYKFNISKRDQKRLKVIDNFYKDEKSSKNLSEKNLNKIFYYHGKQSVIDVISYKLFKLKKVDKKTLNLFDQFKSKILPNIPISAKILMERYNIPEGKSLGIKLKTIEEEWVNNNFEISEKQISKIVSH